MSSVERRGEGFDGSPARARPREPAVRVVREQSGWRRPSALPGEQLGGRAVEPLGGHGLRPVREEDVEQRGADASRPRRRPSQLRSSSTAACIRGSSLASRAASSAGRHCRRPGARRRPGASGRSLSRRVHRPGGPSIICADAEGAVAAAPGAGERIGKVVGREPVVGRDDPAARRVDQRAASPRRGSAPATGAPGPSRADSRARGRCGSGCGRRTGSRCGRRRRRRRG